MHWIALAISLFLFYFASPGIREVSELQDTFSAGVTCYQNKEYEEAIESFLKVVKASKRIPDERRESLVGNALFSVGCCYYRRKEPDYDLAIKYFNKLRKEFPDSSKSEDALAYLGSTYLKIEDYENAIKSYQQRVDKAKEAENVEAEIDLTLQISQCYTKKEDYEKALKTLDKLKSEHWRSDYSIISKKSRNGDGEKGIAVMRGEARDIWQKCQTRHRTGEQMTTKLTSLTLRARGNSKCKFISLAHLLTGDFLKGCFWELNPDKSGLE